MGKAKRISRMNERRQRGQDDIIRIVVGTEMCLIGRLHSVTLTA